MQQDRSSEMELLETRVESARELLEGILPKFEAHLSDEMPKRLQHIRDLLNRSLNTKSIIGVMGPTGAGKSAMLNAVLDEDLILPTNGMRACTATVTEILYNEDDIPYKASVEFISRDEWSRELRALIKDVQDDNGDIHGDIAKGDTIPGLAFSKLSAVYPDLSDDDLIDPDIEELATRGLAKCLGNTVSIEDHDSVQFYAQLQRYVDSRENVDDSEGGSDIDTEDEYEVEFWPLVKVVRIFLKCDVLKDGAVLVDLPGVGDSNAARGAIAESYAQKCDGIFVVTPIHRAVDDGVGKRLFDDAFARQVRLDGMVNEITWICTKADLINEKESIRNSEIKTKTKSLREARDRLRSSRAAKQVQRTKIESQLKTHTSTLKDIEKQLGQTRSLLRNSKDGEGGLASSITSNTLKRKRSATTPHEPERNTSSSKTNDHRPVGISIEGKKAAKPALMSGEASNNGLEARITKLENCWKDVREKKLEMLERLTSILSELSCIDDETNIVNNQITKMCIEARNRYCCATIERIFKSELAPSDAANPSDHNGSNVAADGQSVEHKRQACDIPVICISSHAYQVFRNPADGGNQAVLGFDCIEDTNIPLLRERCQRTAKTLRRASLEGFLNDANILVASLGFWASNQHGVHMKQISEETLGDFVQELLSHCNADIAAIVTEVEASLFDVVSQLIPAAEQKALDITSGWRRSMWVMVYKAIVRRDGCYANRTQAYNFNNDLAGPMLDTIAPAWEKFFLQTIPRTFKQILEHFKQSLTAFMTKTGCLRTENEDNPIFMQKFEKQMQAYTTKLEGILNNTESQIQQSQRGINRSGAHSIQALMSATYAECYLEQGAGMFDRMSEKMWNGVNDNRGRISSSAIVETKSKVLSMIKSAKKTLESNVKDIGDGIKQDCMQLMHEEQNLRTSDLQELKKEIRALIDKYEGNEAVSDPSEDRASDVDDEAGQHVELNHHTSDDEYVHSDSDIDAIGDRPDSASTSPPVVKVEIMDADPVIE